MRLTTSGTAIQPTMQTRRSVPNLVRRSRPRSAPSAGELEAVYREHVSAVYGFFSYSVDPDEAEDLTAATFERVVRSWDQFDPSRSSERTWIFAIARNLLTDFWRWRSHRRGPSLDANPALVESIASADDPLARSLDRDALRGWLEQLAPREREVLALRYVVDLTVAEIAECLDLSAANVHQICSRSLRRLRSAVTEASDAPARRQRAVSDSE
jgi:RNA polymerase sigma-70 factor, ECF subfamily